MNFDAPDTLGPADAYRAGWASAATWGSADRMNDLETLLWRSERHPEQSSTIVMLMTLIAGCACQSCFYRLK